MSEVRSGAGTWRTAVLKRDLYLCRVCKIPQPDIQAHHLDSWSKFPNLRLDIDNGVCLCKRCHVLFHSTYGRKTTREQFDQFVEEIEKTGLGLLDTIEKKREASFLLESHRSQIFEMAKFGGCFIGGEEKERAALRTEIIVRAVEEILGCSQKEAKKWAWQLVQEASESKGFIRIDRYIPPSRADIYVALHELRFTAWNRAGILEHEIREWEKSSSNHYLPASEFKMSKKQIRRWTIEADGNPFALIYLCPWSAQMRRRNAECLLLRAGLADNVACAMLSEALAYISTKARDRDNVFSFFMYWLRSYWGIERCARELGVEYPFVDYHPGYALEIARREKTRIHDIEGFPWREAICSWFPDAQDPFHRDNRLPGR